ncbi:unannotated protein [freshwater metagenome]|uniref:Unannotated protein n=1 Tax=freshwater metagenome TaxID=449393 RepID=A0A6J7HI54_9ZZZZ|nr:acyltransferase family protein [Actinomycetota bacterium]
MPGVLKPSTPKAPASPDPSRGTTSEVRPEIQAMRAVAVALVVIFHLWPSSLPGGYVGVDVFFVISGFLITSHLLREADGSGRLSLLRFWARRARRLLPAALLVLLVCAIGVVTLIARVHWEQFLGEIRASTLYYENWFLADRAVDYWAQGDAASPVRHYWSLSVEEQFYLAWPVIIALAGLAARALRRTSLLRPIAAVALTAVTIGSFVIAIILTGDDPQPAYFNTFARAWEFGAGALLAFAGIRGRGLPARLRALVSWGGLAAIVIAGFVFTETTHFPGPPALLPVLGAVAVLWAGAPGSRISPMPVLRQRPMQFLGDISYSVYLWHWPLLIFLPYILTSASTTVIRLLVIVFVVLFGWLSKRFVEDPVRFSSAAVIRRPIGMLGLGAAAMACVLFVVGVARADLTRQINRSHAAEAAVVKKLPRCFGAGARDPLNTCTTPAMVKKVVPSPGSAAGEKNAPCRAPKLTGRVLTCRFGVPYAKAKRLVLLVGDSHASMFRATLEVVARKRAWAGISITHTGCAFSKAEKTLAPREQTICRQWRRQTQAWIAAHPEVSVVFVAGISGGDIIPTGSMSRQETAVEGYRAMWRALPAHVTDLVYLRDTPKASLSTLQCVEDALAAGKDPRSVCALPRAKVLGPDAGVEAVRREDNPRWRLVGVNDLLCDTSRCFTVIGGALVYKDGHHLTKVFATTLGPILDRRLAAIVRAWTPAAPLPPAA